MPRLAILAGICLVLCTASNSQRVFSANISRTAPEQDFQNDLLTKCFGSSHASTALRADWQAQLTKVHNDLGTEYVRFHGLLDDDMSVVLKQRFRSDEQLEPCSQHTCTFVPHQDYADPAGPVFNASSEQECCDICYNAPTGLPEPCIAAVYSHGRCYTKLNSGSPVSKPDDNISACVTNRTPPKGFTYSWVNIFKVFDFLQSIEIRPVVELSFMPSLLASDPNQTGFWYRGGHSHPKNFDDWQDFIYALGTALVSRYGLDEVKQWYFEVWNEPNCGFYDTANCCGPTCGNKTAYMELFTNTYKGLKKASPQIRVGGPATAQLGWVDYFLEQSVAADCEPDFVSTHLYPTDPFINQTRDGFAQAIQGAVDTVAKTAAQLGKTAPKILITEFNCGLGIECADAPYAASFIAHHAHMAQKTKSAIPFESFWTFSDIFEEQGQQPSEFSQAFGAQSINGVPKPVYRAMQMVRRLQSKETPVVAVDPPLEESIDVIVTRNIGGTVFEVMISNHPGGPRKQGDDRNALRHLNQLQTKGQAANDSITVTIQFHGENVPAKIELRRVDSTHANALVTYSNLGSPAYPTVAELTSLQKGSMIIVETVTAKNTGEKSWEISLDMPSFSVATLSFNA